jgi:hypothetical protein
MVAENIAAGLEALCGPIADLIAAAGLASRFSLTPLTGGANNRVFRVNGANGSRALLKIYFQHPDDQRDRVGAEFAFAGFAWGNGLRSVPQPLACDARNRLALYEFIPGRPLLPCEISEDAVQQALNFSRAINRCKQLDSAKSLPRASECCFSIADHLECVERRLQKLQKVEGSSGIDGEAAKFVRTELSTAWEDVRDRARREASLLGLSPEAEIRREDRCLSPSDFGFHNAILTEGSQVRFVDFEYAGWDDPAKMVCDFFCQQKVPVPLAFYARFVEAVVSDLTDPDAHAHRIGLLMPICRMKWCCILLNEFLPDGRERRRFANEIPNEEERKVHQLRLARVALQHVS